MMYRIAGCHEQIEKSVVYSDIYNGKYICTIVTQLGIFRVEDNSRFGVTDIRYTLLWFLWQPLHKTGACVLVSFIAHIGHTLQSKT